MFLFAMTSLAAVALVAPAAQAGSPHFVSVGATRQGSSLVVNVKEAGLGNEDQVHIVATATALCINGGGNHPKAANKTSVTAQGDFPVQNGHADATLTLTPTFQPPCSPPMTVQFTNLTVTDTTNNLTKKVSGTF